MANKKDNEQLPTDEMGGGVTRAQLAELKAKFGPLVRVAVQVTDNEQLVGWFKEPDKNIMSNVVNRTADKRVFEAREFLLNNTFVAGDKEITTNEKAAIVAGARLYGAIDFLEATVDKY
jgi:hypothetical protein